MKVEEMVESIKEFEDEVMIEFSKAESDFQDKMGDKPYLTLEQTRYITEHLNKTIPEFNVKYQSYVLITTANQRSYQAESSRNGSDSRPLLKRVQRAETFEPKHDGR